MPQKRNTNVSKKPQSGAAGKEKTTRKRRGNNRRSPQVKQEKQTSDTVLKEAGGHGTDVRNAATRDTSALKTALPVVGMDPTLDVSVGYDDRAIQYLAMGTMLRAIKRGWLTQITDASQHPYFAFLYLYNAYRSAANGTIPQLQQAPIFFWEICYGLKPKTQRFKTGQINYTVELLDTQAEENLPPVVYPLGSDPEAYHIMWGMPSNADVNAFYVLAGPTDNYTEEIGAAAIKFLWQSYDGSGLCKLVGDPGNDAFLLNDTSAMGAVYAELGQSFSAPGGAAVTLYSERFIQSPIMTKFAQYQEFENFWRGWHELRKSAGSATYIGPRSSEFLKEQEFFNKVSPIFTIYNFDEYVEQGALIIARIQELASEATSSSVILKPYPLSSLQFQIVLRQALLPYFDNDMGQDLRMSGEATGGNLVTMLPLTVGPNGVSVTAKGANMKMPRFFTEMVRCAKRIKSVLKNPKNKDDRSNVADIIPLLCRPGSIPQLGQYTWNHDGEQVDVFFEEEGEEAIDLIDCSAVQGPDTVYVTLNGPQLDAYTELHNTWMDSASAFLTSICNLGSGEGGVNVLNVNLLTSHVQWVVPDDPNVAAPPTIVTTKEVKGEPGKKKRIPPKIPYHRIKPQVKVQKKLQQQRPTMDRKPSKKFIGHTGVALKVKRVGATPDSGSQYFRDNTGIVKVSCAYPEYAPFWKYHVHMVKPVFFYVAPVMQGSPLQYQTVQIQPYTLPIGVIQAPDVVTAGQLIYPSLFTQHLNAANLDVKAYTTTSKSEMEEEFTTLQANGDGGFFQSLGHIVGGWVDNLIG